MTDDDNHEFMDRHHSTRDIDVGLGVVAHIYISHFPGNDTPYVFQVTFVTSDGQQLAMTGYHSS